MRNKKEIKKAHALNKKVRKEKARLRKRGQKKHELKPTIKAQPRVHIKLDGTTRLLLLEYCEKYNIKPYKAVRQLLSEMVSKDWKEFKQRLHE